MEPPTPTPVMPNTTPLPAASPATPSTTTMPTSQVPEQQAALSRPMPPPPASLNIRTRGGVGEGSFIVQYLGATMMDSHFQYTDTMMPWIIAEIFRFTEERQVSVTRKN